MRATRLMALLMLCRSRDRWTAAQLADELEVSVRTVYRDISALQATGVPLWTESGPGGGIRILPGWSSRVEALTGDEAAALALTGVPSAASELGLGAVALSAQLKVRAALPPELAARAARIEERLHLDLPGWFHRPDPTEHLAEVARAVWSGQRLDLTYRRSDRSVQRRVDPLGLVLKAGTWYLVAAHRGSVRTYRVGRIERCEVRDDAATRPADFDLASWWADSSEEFDRSVLRARCRVRLSPSAQRRLGSVTSPAAAERALAAAGEPDADGWRTAELEIESDEVACSQLIALGAEVEVLAPDSLRTRLHDLGAAIARHHRPAANRTDHLEDRCGGANPSGPLGNDATATSPPDSNLPVTVSSL